MEPKINIFEDLDGKKIVMIHDIRFKGKRKINWKEVESYLKEYVGSCYEIAETAEKIRCMSESGMNTSMIFCGCKLSSARSTTERS